MESPRHDFHSVILSNCKDVQTLMMESSILSLFEKDQPFFGKTGKTGWPTFNI